MSSELISSSSSSGLPPENYDKTLGCISQLGDLVEDDDVHVPLAKSASTIFFAPLPPKQQHYKIGALEFQHCVALWLARHSSSDCRIHTSAAIQQRLTYGHGQMIPQQTQHPIKQVSDLESRDDSTGIPIKQMSDLESRDDLMISPSNIFLIWGLKTSHTAAMPRAHNCFRLVKSPWLSPGNWSRSSVRFVLKSSWDAGRLIVGNVDDPTFHLV